MNNFTVMTDAQLAAHDASTSKRYQAAAQEAQATIAKQATRIAALEAHIRKFTNRHSEAARRQQELVSALSALMDSDQKDIAGRTIMVVIDEMDELLAVGDSTRGEPDQLGLLDDDGKPTGN